MYRDTRLNLVITVLLVSGRRVSDSVREASAASQFIDQNVDKVLLK